MMDWGKPEPRGVRGRGLGRGEAQLYVLRLRGTQRMQEGKVKAQWEEEGRRE